MDDKFDRGDCGEDKATILSTSSISKDQTKAGYLSSSVKKACNHLRHAFIQAFILSTL